MYSRRLDENSLLMRQRSVTREYFGPGSLESGARIARYVPMPSHMMAVARAHIGRRLPNMVAVVSSDIQWD